MSLTQFARIVIAIITLSAVVAVITACDKGPSEQDTAKLGATLLMAAANGNLKLLELCLKDGADVNTKDANGATALVLACSSPTPDLKLITVLVTKGAQVNAKDNERNTPLSRAFERGNLLVVMFLVRHGADFDVTNAQGETVLLAAAGDQRRVPNDPLVKLLLDKRTDANARDKLQRTPLIRACESPNYALNVGTVNSLIQKHADVNAADANGRTPVMAACTVGNTNVVTTLLKNGANVNAADKNLKTPLMHALENGHFNIATVLIANKADVNAKDSRGWTAANYAQQRLTALNALMKKSGAK